MMKRKQRPLIISSACGFAAKTSGKPFSRCLTTLANHILRWALLTAQPKAVEDQVRFSMGHIIGLSWRPGQELLPGRTLLSTP